MTTKILSKDDALIWKNLRLEGLQNAPSCFGSSYEEECTWSDAQFEDVLKNNDIFGAFIGHDLVSSVSFCRLKSVKTMHRGVVWGMYTQPEYRGKGIASRLLETVILHAKLHVRQLHLTCVTDNPSAIKLYEKHGFRIYGTEPRSLKINDKFYNEHFLILEF